MSLWSKFLIILVSLMVILANSASFTSKESERLAMLKCEASNAQFLPDAIQEIERVDTSLCYTKPCLDSALEILEGLDVSKNPCESTQWLDFVCSRRVNSTRSERTYSGKVGQSWSNKFDMNFDLMEELKETKSSHYAGQFLFKEASTYFRQCEATLNSFDGAKDAEIVADMVSFVKQEFGVAWPAFSEESATKDFAWLDVLALLNRNEPFGSLDYFEFRPLFLRIWVNPVGQILMGDRTVEALDDLVEYETLGERIAKILSNSNKIKRHLETLKVFVKYRRMVLMSRNLL